MSIENRLSFQNIYRKSRLSFSVTEISRDKDTRFFACAKLKITKFGERLVKLLGHSRACEAQ